MKQGWKKLFSKRYSIIFGVAFVWFTTHFGGGFASGAQPYVYLMPYGIWALIIPFIAMAYDAFFYGYALYYARKHQLYDYNSFNRHFYGRYQIFTVLFEIMFIVVMFIPPSVAFATGGSLLQELTGLPYIVSTLIVGVFIYIVAVFGTNVVRKVASILSIAIVIGLLVVYVPNIILNWDTIAANISTLSATSFNGEMFLNALKAGLIYATFQVTNIGAMFQHAEPYEKPQDAVPSMIFGWVVNAAMLLLAVLGLFSVVLEPDIFTVSVPILRMVQKGVAPDIMTPLVSVLIILGAVTTAVNLVAAMTKRLQAKFEAPEITKAAEEKGRPTKVGLIACFVCCAVDFCIAQFGLLPLIGKGGTLVSYMALPIIILPYIVHIIATKFDKKNPPRISE